MPLVSTVAAVAAPDADAPREHARLQAGLRRRLRRLERVFDIAAVRRGTIGAAQVVEYYEQCHDAYRKYHSAEGAAHMALNGGGRFDPDGFYGQLRRIESAWTIPPAAVLELAYGQGFNLAYLGRRHPGVRFAGIDLTPAHGEIAQRRIALAGLANVVLASGDFHRLPYADASFDEVYCVEAFCYARDLPRALAEVSRVLRPGGIFTLFDGYLTRPSGEMADAEALAVELVARGLAIEALQVQSEVLAAASAARLSAAAVHALDEAVMPSLRRLERTTGAVIRFPWLARRALARRPAARGRNVLAGYLMRSTVALGLIGYRHIVLRKDP